MLIAVGKKLTVGGGHESTQIAALRALVGEHELLVVTEQGYVAPDLVEAPTSVRTVLSDWHYQVSRPDQAIEQDVTALHALLTSPEITTGPRPGVVIPTAAAHDIRVCLLLLERAPKIARFCLRILCEDILEPLNETELSALRQHIASGSVWLTTETASLSRRLAAHHGLTATDDFVLPCTVLPDDPLPPETAETFNMPAGARRIRVGYLGGLRREKGFWLIPRIIGQLSALLRRSAPDIQVEVLIAQHNRKRRRIGRLWFDFCLWRSSRGWQGNRRGVTVTRTPAIQTSAEFKALLASTDLLLLPYNLARYRFRGSGVILDGVLAQKPFVYTDGIGMDDLLSFGNAEPAVSAQEFAASILKIVRQAEGYQSSAAAARKAVIERFGHTAQMLQRLLVCT